MVRRLFPLPLLSGMLPSPEYAGQPELNSSGGDSPTTEELVPPWVPRRFDDVVRTRHLPSSNHARGDRMLTVDRPLIQFIHAPELAYCAVVNSENNAKPSYSKSVVFSSGVKEILYSILSGG
ncbi:hypothetical protein ACJJTC_001921 [Scirpophaga incertulas]